MPQHAHSHARNLAPRTFTNRPSVRPASTRHRGCGAVPTQPPRPMRRRVSQPPRPTEWRRPRAHPRFICIEDALTVAVSNKPRVRQTYSLQPLIPLAASACACPALLTPAPSSAPANSLPDSPPPPLPTRLPHFSDNLLRSVTLFAPANLAHYLVASTLS